ncbi:MAG: NUDIX domain-containing protein [Burkholderiaceae bacterium]|nr:NUDIX domain-containing protein [Burkholderiaceae bacterium]
MKPALSLPVEVAVGVVFNAAGQVLFAQRPKGKPYEGWWEFPGGKIEAGEFVQAALARELQEELGIKVLSCQPWLTREFVYPHARVRLHFCKILAFEGQPQGLENQAFVWDDGLNPSIGPILPATLPLLRCLSLPSHLKLLTRQSDLQLVEGEQWYLAEEAEPGGLHMQSWLAALHGWRSQVKHAILIGSRGFWNGPIAVEGLFLKESELESLSVKPAFLSHKAWFCAEVKSRKMLNHAAQIGCDFVLVPYISHGDLSDEEQEQNYWAEFSEIAHQAPLPVYAKNLSGDVLGNILSLGGQGLAR